MRVSNGGRFGSGLVFAAALFSFALPAAQLAPALAQQAAPVAQPTAAQIELARNLVMVNGEGRAFDGIIPSIVEGVERTFVQTNPDLTKQLHDAAIVVAADLDKRKSEIIDILAGAYARRFSETELKEAVAFYRSATGTKLVQDRPVIVQEAVLGIQAWGSQLNQQVMEGLRAEMKKRGIEL